MLNKILPVELVQIIENIAELNKIKEVRIRCNKPICLWCDDKYIVVTNKSNKLYADKKLIDYIILKITDGSLYSYNYQLKQMFICFGGIRVGVCGEVVEENGQIKTIKNITSLVIRLPYQILGCSNKLMQFMFNNNKVNNTLIISPPGCGKTTMLRDLALNICNNDTKIINGLIIDERFEIAGTSNLKLNTGAYADVIGGSTKNYAFTNAIRALKPDVIFTDELFGEDDYNAIKLAVASGVSVVATIHGDSFETLKKQEASCKFINSKLFDVYIFLKYNNGHIIESVYNTNYKPLYGGDYYEDNY